MNKPTPSEERIQELEATNKALGAEIETLRQQNNKKYTFEFNEVLYALKCEVDKAFALYTPKERKP